MRLILALLLLVLSLPCTATDYHPSIYPLRAELIAPLRVNGNVSIVNAQPSVTQDIVYKYSFAKMTGTMHDVTQTMIEQTRLEIGLKDQPPTPGDKVIELKVNSLLSKYKFFYWNSQLQFEARLGDGTVIVKDVPHSSGILIQDLNGCIAESVMTLLNDPKVRAYIESPTAGATEAAPMIAPTTVSTETPAAAIPKK